MKIILPLILIAIGVILKLTKNNTSNLQIKKYWWIFVLIGVIKLILSSINFLIS